MIIYDLVFKSFLKSKKVMKLSEIKSNQKEIQKKSYKNRFEKEMKKVSN